LSTGDEIVSVGTAPLPPGCVRDVNGAAVSALLSKYGFPAEYRGIVKDDAEEFEKRVKSELADCDVLILSGGSSVGVRDNCSRVLEALPAPGLLIRGINIVPGKPTLIAGCAEEKKLVVSLPGHPLSCVSAAFTVLIPLLLKMSSHDAVFPKHSISLELAYDLNAKTGPEEFTPCDGKVYPISAKSGYVSALSSSDGLVRIPEDMETVRKGEHVEVWLW
ncbi:MAG: molybdopterin-binding protein, partial [Synergistaceae bacterium]